RLDAVDLPSVSGRDFHEHAGIATDVEEPLAKGITHHLLDWAKVPLERQHPPLALLLVERILDGFVLLEEFSGRIARVGIDETAAPATDDRMVLSVPEICTAVGFDLRVFAPVQSPRIDQVGLIRATKVAGNVLQWNSLLLGMLVTAPF